MKHIYTIENSFEMGQMNELNSQELKELRKSVNLDLDKQIFVASGSLIKRKNPLWLIRFWKNYFAHDTHRHLMFLGDGPLMKECRDLAGNVQNIHFMGNVKNVFDFYSISDVFLSASLAEGLPNAVLEALAKGNICLLSSIEPHKEIAAKMKESVYLFDTDNESSLHNKIISLPKVGSEKAKNDTSCLVLKIFAPRKMAKRYEQLYMELILGA